MFYALCSPLSLCLRVSMAKVSLLDARFLGKMKRSLPILLLLAILISLLAVASCDPKPSQRSRGTIRIGYLGDLSGVTYNFGQSARNGVLMAAGEIDQAGGLGGRQIDVVIEDDQGKPEFAASQISKLIDVEKAIAVIVGGTSNDSR